MVKHLHFHISFQVVSFFHLFIYVLNCILDYFLNARQKLTIKSIQRGERGGLMVSVLESGSNALGSRPNREHCVVFLDKTLYSHCATHHPGV